MAGRNWYFCVTPDWANNTGQLLNPFWYDDTNDQAYPPNVDPRPKVSRGDKVAFAVKVTQSGDVDNYSVDDITVISTIRNNPAGNGASRAAVPAPFRKGNKLVTHFSGPPNATPVNIPDGKYMRTAVHKVYSDQSVNAISAYEITMSATASQGNTQEEFSIDPEMDVDNN